MNFNFIKAKKEEINIAFTLLKEAAQRLETQNIHYWSFWLNPPKEKINWIEEGFENQEFYFVKNEQQTIIGMFGLMSKDVLYWGEKNDNARYIHSFVTQNQFAGKKIGHQIINQIETNIKQENISILRLDCNAHNQNLCQYYENLGFKKVGEKQMPLSLNNLYEKNLM
jgi:RimJ/RimL family protein N-acetyltransferase